MSVIASSSPAPALASHKRAEQAMPERPGRPRRRSKAENRAPILVRNPPPRTTRKLEDAVDHLGDVLTCHRGPRWVHDGALGPFLLCPRLLTCAEAMVYEVARVPTWRRMLRPARSKSSLILHGSSLHTSRSVREWGARHLRTTPLPMSRLGNVTCTLLSALHDSPTSRSHSPNRFPFGAPDTPDVPASRV